MAKRIINGEIKVTGIYEIEFDDESPEYIEALGSYKSVIDSDGDEEAMLQHVIYNVAVNRARDVEGVGCVTLDGRSHSHHDFPAAGISLKTQLEAWVEYELSEVKSAEP